MGKNKRAVFEDSKRLRLYPMSDEDLQVLIDNESDSNLKAAYEEMLLACKNDPENRIWYAPWVMMERVEEKMVGFIGFKGPVKDECVEIGYGIQKEYEGHGYTKEAVDAMCKFALSKDGIYFVEAETENSNEASKHILEVNGFTKYGKGSEGPRYVKEKIPTSYTPLGIALGLCLGIGIGTALGNTAIGICLGISFGMLFGKTKDDEAFKNFTAAKNRREERLKK